MHELISFAIISKFNPHYPQLRPGPDPEVLYGKWQIHIIYYIGDGALRPSDIQRKIPEVTRRVLNIQLRQLELHDIITKKVFPQLPPKVEYSLTEFGKTLLPVIDTTGNWGDNHQEHLRDVITSSVIYETENLNP